MTGGWLLLGAVWLGAAALHLLYGVAFLVRCIHVGRSRPSVFMCAVVICVWPLLVNRILFMAFEDEDDERAEDAA